MRIESAESLIIFWRIFLILILSFISDAVRLKGDAIKHGFIRSGDVFLYPLLHLMGWVVGGGC